MNLCRALHFHLLSRVSSELLKLHSYIGVFVYISTRKQNPDGLKNYYETSKHTCRLPFQQITHQQSETHGCIMQYCILF